MGIKKGQNTTHEKEYFNSGIGGKISSSALHNIVKGWGDNKTHQKAKNVARSSKKKKRK